ncbi:HD domain-containing protein [Patescibacteria group bacterium]|nr:HD domain-containing protein [Patescibacteria group bacterium]MBU1868723.1 HD domain-containing protein [Patescibacteria group bacterium]
MTRKQAWEKLNELMSNKNLIKHCLAVEAAMIAYAHHFGVGEEEKETWAIAGLLHDADYEKYPDQHPQIVVAWLEEKSVSAETAKDKNAVNDLINAIEAHGFEFNVEPKTLMAKILRAVDELTGLIVAVALVRPNKKIVEVNVQSILKKWNIPSFAAGVNRQDVVRGASEIDVDLEQHIEIVLKAMQEIADKLGL